MPGGLPMGLPGSSIPSQYGALPLRVPAGSSALTTLVSMHGGATSGDGQQILSRVRMTGAPLQCPIVEKDTRLDKSSGNPTGLVESIMSSNRRYVDCYSMYIYRTKSVTHPDESQSDTQLRKCEKPTYLRRAIDATRDSRYNVSPQSASAEEAGRLSIAQ